MLSSFLRATAVWTLVCFGMFGGCVRDPQHSTSTAVHPTELEQGVGEHIRAIVESPETVAFADLQVVAADEAQARESLAGAMRIAGYPIIGTLRQLDESQANILAKAFADSSNYDPKRRSRCAIGRIIGFRFVRGSEHVDIALTDPCALAMWSFKRNEINDEWAAPFHRGLTQQIVELVATR